MVLVHGYGSGRGAFTPLKRSLRAHGFQRFADHGYLTHRKSFDDLVDALDAFIRQSAPTGPLLLVGHSLGGLLCRAYLQRGGAGAARTLALCTLSTPHAGLWVADYLEAVPVLRELSRESAAVARLRAGDRQLEALPALSIVSSRDHFVRPALGAAFGPARLRIVDHVGHVGVLFDAAVQSEVADFLLEVTPSEAFKESP